jgi:cell division protease FtsH
MSRDRFSPAWLERHRVVLPPVDRSAIVGIGHVLAEIDGLIAALGNPEAARALGVEPPRGVYLWGRPGTGKTLTARYVASALGPDVPLYELPAEALGPAQVRGTFRHLSALGSRSVVFIDDLDAIATHMRPPSPVQTALLGALDGLVPTAGAILVAAGNAPPFQLSSALTRPGRLTVHVAVGVPSQAERILLFERFLSERAVAPDLDVARLARLARGATPAAIRAAVDDAARLSLASGSSVVTAAAANAALRRGADRLPAQLESPELRHRRAVHESGHVGASLRLRGAEWIHTVRITPTGGRTMWEPEGDRERFGEDVLADMIVVALAGIAAERSVLGYAGLGSSHDVASATEIAVSILEAGLDPAVPPVSLRALPGSLAHGFRGPYCRSIGRRLSGARQQAAEIVAESVPFIRAFAEILETAEELTGADLKNAIEMAGLAADSGAPGPESG